jgi:hypothetical protein
LFYININRGIVTDEYYKSLCLYNKHLFFSIKKIKLDGQISALNLSVVEEIFNENKTASWIDGIVDANEKEEG